MANNVNLDANKLLGIDQPENLVLRPDMDENQEQSDLVNQSTAPSTPSIQSPIAKPEIALPSTKQNQLETSKILDDKKQLQNAQKAAQDAKYQKFLQAKMKLQAARPSGMPSENDDELALDLMDQEEQEAKAKTAEDLLRQKSDLDKLLAKKAKFEKHGIPVPADLTSQIESLQSSIPSEVSDIDTSVIAGNAEINQKVQELREQEAAELAVQQVEAEKQQKQEKQKAKVENDFKKAKDEIQDIDPQRFWNNQSTGTKIGFVIAAALSGFAGKPELVLNQINSLMENDIKAQQINQKEAIRKLYQGYELKKRELENEALKTSNALTKTKIASIVQGMDLKQQELLMKAYNMERMAAGDIDIESLTEEQRKRLVITKDGKKQLASSSKQAELFNEKYADGISSITALSELMNIAEDPTAFANIYSRAEAQVRIRSLIGKVRLSLFGPGVMTDYEQNLAKQIIGDPTKIFSLRSVEKQKLKTFKKIVENDLKTSAQQAGIKLPVDVNQVRIQQVIEANKKAGKNLTEDEAEKALRANNLWKSDV